MAIPVSGNTFPVKEQLKALGGRWDAARKCWMIPEQNADKAFALVQNAPRSAQGKGTYRQYTSSARGAWTGCSCGSREDNPRPSDCASCQHDY